MSEIHVLAKAKVLGLPVDAAYQRNSDGSSDWIVYGRLPSPEWMTITDLLNQIGNMVTLGITKDAIGDALPDQLTAVLDDIKFRLIQVYYKQQTKPTAENQEEPNDEDIQKKPEYSFHIEVDISDITEGFPIEVENISFKMWSTANQLILDEMDINRINRLLGNEN